MFTLQSLGLRPTVMPNSVHCNLRCRYCYCDRRHEITGCFMKETTLEILTRKFLEAYPRFISFCWHGGEPLLSGIEFFVTASKLQEKYRQPSQIVENRLQTNATLLNQEWAEFFKEFDYKIGVSIDGPAWLNDKQRKDVRGFGTFKRIMRGIDVLRANDIDFGVIIVVTNETVKYPDEIYKFIVKQGFTSVSLNPCFGNNPFVVNPIEYAHFMNRIFDLWLEEDRDNLSIGFLEDIMKWFLGGKPNICHLCKSCYRHVKIEYNGDVLPCDEFFGKGFKLGNIISQELSEIVNSEEFKRFFHLVTTPVEECRRCEWYELCGGGCSRYSFSGSFTKHLNSMCESRRLIFQHIGETIQAYQ